ncbi:MAG: thiamine pyrophosphate-binding protein [SAR202 cluster bacterium]|nr:thiamine pyrophosphate-binding protein [SAR202 cluster bacterium]
MNNAQLMVRMFEQAGVRSVFGVPSGPVLPLIDALRESATARFVLTATETSAAFMAEATGRLTGIPGVCVSTLGPGATNMATGVGGAWLDRSPVVAITCTYDSRMLDRRTQMRIDHLAMFAPMTKAQWRLEPGNMADTLARAMTLACAEPPGPVFLELPEDVSKAEATEQPIAFEAPPPITSVAGAGRHVLEALRGAKRSMVVTGLTFTRARSREALLRFIDTQRLPYTTTLHAKGFLPESHPFAIGVMGRARRTNVQRMIDQADLLICIGYDPIEINYEEWCKRIPVLHLSTEHADVDGGVTLIGDMAGNLDAMIAELADLPPVPNEWKPEDLARHREQLDRDLRPASNGMAAYHVLDVLRSRLPHDAIVAYDVGAHTHQIATQWRTDLPHTAVATNGWSSMGYGMPAAYAAKLARPERTVVGIVGDGCFQMTVGELAMARRMGIRAPVIVLNDGWLGLMKVKQERSHYDYNGSFLGETVGPPEHYFGVPVRGARDEKGLREALDWALAHDGPTVIEAFIDVEPYSYSVFDK